ncbi:MAG: hypothetical protein K0S14_3331, partial [Thermomicrobiales bacterium]|nr:hypothetical protein [Thermomicrobiales bacterium]
GEAATATIAPRILLVSDLPGALARALMAIENVQLTIEPGDNLGAIAAGGYDLVVFDRTTPSTETLSKVDSASLWVGPPVGGPFATAEGIADPKVTRVRAGDPLLAGVDLSGASFGPTPIFTLSAGDEEIVGSTDGPLLFRTEVNDQPAVVLTVDPETSNLPKRVASRTWSRRSLPMVFQPRSRLENRWSTNREHPQPRSRSCRRPANLHCFQSSP